LTTATAPHLDSTVGRPSRAANEGRLASLFLTLRSRTTATGLHRLCWDVRSGIWHSAG